MNESAITSIANSVFLRLTHFETLLHNYIKHEICEYLSLSDVLRE